MAETLYWTGVGARYLKSWYQHRLLTRIAYAISTNNQKSVLRSGKASGSDTAFQLGVELCEGEAEIYIPWKLFENEEVSNKYDISLSSLDSKLVNEAWDLVKQVHPYPSSLSPGAIKLHTRNVFQVLGKDLNTPSRFLLACAENDYDGNLLGGTNTAWQVAKLFNVPHKNLIDYSDSGLLTMDEAVSEITAWINSL